MPILVFLQFDLETFICWCDLMKFWSWYCWNFNLTFTTVSLWEPRKEGMGDEPWFWSMFVTMLRLHCWCYSSPQLRIKTYKPVMLHQPMWFRLPFKWGKSFLIWYRNSWALFDLHTRCLPCIQLIQFSKFHLVHLTLSHKVTHRSWFLRLFAWLNGFLFALFYMPPFSLPFLCLTPHIH